MGSCRWLIGDGPVAQGHADNGRHMSLGAKHVDGDSSGLPCEREKRAHRSSLQVPDQSPHDSAKVPLQSCLMSGTFCAII